MDGNLYLELLLWATRVNTTAKKMSYFKLSRGFPDTTRCKNFPQIEILKFNTKGLSLIQYLKLIIFIRESYLDLRVSTSLKKMKRIILILILSIFSISSLKAQQSISQTEKLASLAKVYGFLKYYHPEVAKGKFDWDKAVLNQLPKVLRSNDKESLSLVYVNWIESLGEIDRCKKCDSEENYFDKNFDLSWLENSTIFSDELISKLKYIEKNRNQKENVYASTEGVGNVKITNEPQYKDFDYPNEEYRLLGLFKYWNIIEYFYPYKYLTDQNWDAVLMEMIPKIQNASDIYEYHFTLEELVAKLDDSHAHIGFNNELNKHLPVKISHIEGRAVISGFYNDSIASLNNLKLGDVILKINDLDIDTEREKQLNYVSGSNPNYKTKKTYDRIFNGRENLVKLTIKRDGQLLEIEVKRYDFNEFKYWYNPRQNKSKTINEKIGYIHMGSRFLLKELNEIFKLFKDKEYIIVDLRTYPERKYKMFTRFFNSEKRVFAKIYSPDISYPGKFIYNDGSETSSSRKAFEGKFILLVSEETLSLSEFTAMAFQTADNIITVGNQTAGADGRNIEIEYLGGYKTSFSGYGILYPDGTETQRKGVKIDIEVKPTINGLRQGRDEILEKAIEIANE